MRTCKARTRHREYMIQLKISCVILAHRNPGSLDEKIDPVELGGFAPQGKQDVHREAGNV
jgi:hypothetical protein